MNTTHKVSIGGMAFVVDESAFNELKTYTDRLHAQFSHRADGQEIVADIESRIAELLNGKILTPDQVVTLADVKDVLLRIGDPSELDEGGEKTGEQRSYGFSTISSRRRLYRSADNKVIGGVCGGLGAYFNLDPVLFRIAFVGLTILGFPIAIGWFIPIAYIVLWISAPLAVTVGQKLEMEGKKVNVSDMEQRIREGAHNMAPHIRTAGESALSVVGVLVKIVAIFFASIFVITGLAVSTALLVSLFGIEPWVVNNFVSFDHDMDFALFGIVSSFFPHLIWFKLSLFALAIIPTILMIILMIKLLFKSRFRTRFVVIPLTVLWVVALFAAMFTGILSLKGTFGGNSSVNETVYAQAPIDTLNIAYSDAVKLNPNDVLISLEKHSDDDFDNVNVNINGEDIVKIGNHHRGWEHHHGFSIVSADNVTTAKIDRNSTVYVRPIVYIEFSENIDKPEVIVKKWATGRNYNTATQTAEEIKFDATFKGDSLLISPAIPLKLSDRILKGIELTVLIPKDKAYRISKDMLSSVKKYNSKKQNDMYIFSESGSNSFEDENIEEVDTVEVKATDKF
jgi:phage shock protein PspC (stress-responsive transcriptional regulator)